jgi:ribosome assembly protein 4
MHAGSDDFTLFLWEPTSHKLPRARMAGHMQLVNQVTAMRTAVLVHRICTLSKLRRRPGGCKLLNYFALLQVTFSPDGRWIASASFDKSGVLFSFSCKDPVMGK